MKVRINFTVDIDVETWCLEYGIKPSEVREDVKCYVEYGTHSTFDGLGLLVKKETA
jgi:hypothetical protein